MIKKTLLTVFIMVLILFTMIMVQPVSPNQVDQSDITHEFPQVLADKDYDIDSLKSIVGENKGLPEGFELAALIAYSAYPELKGVQIDMVLTEEGAPMESNFDIGTLFGKGENRVYKILLNNASGTKFDQILLRSLPFDAQVGILAHELGHVAYYHQLSTLQIAKWGIMYLISDEFRSTHEKDTDMMPVYHGLGNQIYQYAYYVRNDPSCVDLYRKYADEFIDKFYMTDKELKTAIEERNMKL